MLRPTFQRALNHSFAFPLLSAVFFLNVFGQNAPNAKCAMDDYECLVVAYTKEINSAPKDYRNYYSRGLLYVYLKNYEAALRDYNQAIVLNPKSDEALSGRGYVYQMQNRLVEAITELNKAIELNPKNAYAVNGRKAILQLMSKSYTAIEDYGKLIELEPDNAEYYYFRAAKYFQIKDYARAVEDAAKAIELDPKNIDAFAVRSDSYCKLGKPKESNADINRYETLTGKKTKASCDFCDDTPINCEIKRLSKAIALAMKKQDSQYLIELYDERGILYYKNGDYDLALSDFNKTENKQGNVPSSVARGDIHLRKGRYDDALFDFKYYLSNHQGSVIINVRVGQIYLVKSDFDEAFKYFDTAIFLNSGNSEARLGRAAVYLERAEKYSETGRDEIASVEEYRNAVEDFTEAIKNDKKINPKVYLKRAAAYEQIGEPEKAEADRQKYIELSEQP